MPSVVESLPIGDGAFRIRGAPGCSEVYLLEGGRTLIDAGNMFGLADEMRALGALHRLERVVLTHAHFDHVGGIREIYQAAVPDLYVHPLAREHLMNALPDPYPQFIHLLASDGRLKVIDEGETLPGRSSLEVLHVPGHTAGDLCLWDAASRSLFSGDVLMVPSAGGQARGWERVDEALGGAWEIAAGSLRRLLGRPVRHIFPGHGDPILERGADRIKRSLLECYRRLYPENPERAWTAVAEDLAGHGQFMEARQCLRKALKLAPADRKALELLAQRSRSETKDKGSNAQTRPR